MFKAAVTIVCLCVASICASPLESSGVQARASKTKSYTATFELTNNGGIYGPPLPGAYDGLYYANITNGPFNYQSGFCAGVCPQSFPAQAVFGSGYSNNTGPLGSVSIIYPRSNVTSFQLNSFYFGCEADQGDGYAQRPANCTITVNGYTNAKGRFPVSSTKPQFVSVVDYIPQITSNPHTGAPAANMLQVTLAKWKNLKAVTFTATAGPPAVSAPLVFLDNLEYVTMNATKT